MVLNLSEDLVMAGDLAWDEAIEEVLAVEWAWVMDEVLDCILLNMAQDIH